MFKGFVLTFHYFVSRFSGCRATTFLGSVPFPFRTFLAAYVACGCPLSRAPAGGRADGRCHRRTERAPLFQGQVKLCPHRPSPDPDLQQRGKSPGSARTQQRPLEPSAVIATASPGVGTSLPAAAPLGWPPRRGGRNTGLPREPVP